VTKLWLDDERYPPDGSWTHVRSVIDAKKLVVKVLQDRALGPFTHVSLDHDLGDVLSADDTRRKRHRPPVEQTGLVFTDWLVEKILSSDSFRESFDGCEWVVHSWNPVGNRAMIKSLERGGVHALLRPFVRT